jgi:aryl-phospho-beta-D-glucosidase BglC (GH1 family)
MRSKIRKNLVKSLLMLVIFALSMACFSADIMANTKYGRLTGVNWFGFETGNYVVHGIWSRDYKSMLQQIKDMGFNCIRMPWCYQMLSKTPTSIQINASGVDSYTGKVGLNTDLAGLTSLEVMDKIIDYAGTLGLKIVLDCHSLAADQYAAEGLWYTNAYTEADWINGWKTMATRYKNRSNVVGADLKNEPHGNLGQGQKPPATWGYDAPGYTNTNWKAAAERCASAILAINPNLVIIIEGPEMAKDQTTYWWGGNLQDVGTYPITSIPAANLQYSFHEYGSGVFHQTWFDDPAFPSNMAAIWDQHFYYIQKQGLGQLFLGEFGITEANAANTSSIDYKWLTTLMAYVGKNVDWTFWSWNPDSGDTGGILKDDWVSVNTAKYNIIKPYLAGSVTGPTPTVAPTTPTPKVTPTPGRTATPIPTPTPVRAQATPTPVPANGSIKVQMYNSGTAATSNSISPQFRLVNTGTSAIALSSVKIRYYYTIDGVKSQSFFCDYSNIGSANVTGAFVSMTTPATGADYYLEIGFSANAGNLDAGASANIQTRFAKSDWSNYTQTNDYSLNSTGTAYADWTKVTGYVSGVLQWGTEP